MIGLVANVQKDVRYVMALIIVKFAAILYTGL